MTSKSELTEQWERVQTKTFTNWVNSHLVKRGKKIESLLEDLQDGVNLILLLESISGEIIDKYNKNPRMRVQKAENVNKALKFIKDHDVKLVSIGAEDIIDGNVKLTLGLIWTVILRFAIAGLSEEGLSAKEGLLLWCRRKTEPYDNVDVKDFTVSFQDGLAFCALIHRHRPDLIDYEKLTPEDKLGNLNLAFDVAHEHLDCAKLLDAEDIVNMPRPDERSIMTYVAQLYNVFSSLDKVETAGRRIGKLVNLNKTVDELTHDYEDRANALNDAISRKIDELNNAGVSHDYAPARHDVADFRDYRKTTKRQWVTEQEELAALYSSIQAKLKTSKRPPYQAPASASLAAVESNMDQLNTAEHARRKQLNDNLRNILDRLRRGFADVANPFGDALASLKAALATSAEQELEEQLRTLQGNYATLQGLAGNLPAIEQAEAACDAANIDENEYTDHRYDDLLFSFDRLNKTYTKQIAFIQNQIQAAQTADVSAEMLQEFKESFDHFDNDKNGTLSRLEFKSALSGLGVVSLDFEGGDKKFDGIFQKVSGGTDHVNFNQFVEYMVSITADDTSESQIRDSFDTLAGGKDFLTVGDMRVGQLNDQQIQYLTSTLPPKAGIEGGYDYRAWLNSSY